MPKHDESEKHFQIPEEIEKHMEELKVEEMIEEKEVIKEETEIEKQVVVDEEKEEKSYHSTPKPEIYHPSMSSHSPRPHYHASEQPLYIPKRHYSPHPVRPIHKASHHRSYKPSHKSKDTHHEEGDYKSDEAPKCAVNDKYYCDKDDHYPEYEIMNAAHKHADQLLALYADIADLNTELSVSLPKKAEGEESYVCPSDITYAQLFRAKNTEGKWRIILNNIKVNYQTLTQTVRLEECLMGGQSCPLVPHCYESKCLQKSVYHKFLVFEPYDHYFPFVIESFKLPASCACHLGVYEIAH